jgi:hypothetical protein
MPSSFNWVVGCKLIPVGPESFRAQGHACLPWPARRRCQRQQSGLPVPSTGGEYGPHGQHTLTGRIAQPFKCRGPQLASQSLANPSSKLLNPQTPDTQTPNPEPSPVGNHRLPPQKNTTSLSHTDGTPSGSATPLQISTSKRQQ